MARSSALGDATNIEPGPDDRKVASLIRSADSDARLLLRLSNGEEVELPDALAKVVRASATEISEGHTITVLASETLLTPAEVGELLGLSRPFVARLLDQGVIASEHLPDSSHRVVRLADALAFQARRERRQEGRKRISQIIESGDLPY
ncbi:hypothetical protein GCM10007977_031280 [Dactylosporangium sucinum]|uniref:Helix-turn-helix domain-containing protein n=1 Tax=Dactylosporangium sucinum TaxID=1424081 RepID=A0A917TNT1_9ACTN|nr:hypothetical protein GCM10007977_031280 [Dactylosporangium sucinum]